jgi:hypothetical protein
MSGRIDPTAQVVAAGTSAESTLRQTTCETCGETVFESPALPPDLLAVLDAHGVAATEGAVLAACAEREVIRLAGPIPGVKDMFRWDVCRRNFQSHMWIALGYGETPLIALARAFVALVGETEEGE